MSASNAESFPWYIVRHARRARSLGRNGGAKQAGDHAPDHAALDCALTLHFHIVGSAMDESPERRSASRFRQPSFPSCAAGWSRRARPRRSAASSSPGMTFSPRSIGRLPTCAGRPGAREAWPRAHPERANGPSLNHPVHRRSEQKPDRSRASCEWLDEAMSLLATSPDMGHRNEKRLFRRICG